MANPIYLLRNPKQTKLSFNWSADDTTRAHDLFEESVGEIPAYLQTMVFVSVRGYDDVQPYVRALPGKKDLGDALGKDFFTKVGVLVSVGFQVYDDWNRSDLTRAQKFARADVAIFDVVPPIALAHAAINLFWPGQWDRATAYAFSPSAPWVNFISDKIVKYGGAGFQQWAVKPKPHWVEFMLN